MNKYLTSSSLGLMLTLMLVVSACKQDNSSKPNAEVANKEAANDGVLSLPDWANSANIYEVNVKQYGTFIGVSDQLDLLDKMGVDILLLKSIYAITDTPDDPDAILDYQSVNTAYGTKKDFKLLVDKAHKLGMKIILNCMPNRITDALQSAQIDAMKYWIKEFNIDGYNQDKIAVSNQAFWVDATPALLAERSDLFLITDSASADNLKTFHATVTTSLYPVLADIAAGQKSETAIDEWRSNHLEEMGSSVSIHKVSNRDKSDKPDPAKASMDDRDKAMAVLAMTLDGIPLIQTTQDATDMAFYSTLLQLKHKNKALSNIPNSGTLSKLGVSDTIYAFERKNGADKVVVMVNLGAKETFVNIQGHISGVKEVFDGSSPHYHSGDQVKLGPWAYIVASNR